MTKNDTPSARRAAEFLDGGRICTGAALAGAGLSRASVSRLLADGVLQRVGSRGVMLSDQWEGDPWAPVAQAYGGTPGAPHGVVCLRSAAILHGLTDLEQHQLGRVDVAVPRGTSHRTRGLEARVIRWSRPAAFDPAGLEWRDFGGHGIHVTTAARTVCDLFSPWRDAGADGRIDIEALGRLVARSPDEAALAVAFARGLGWEQQVANAYEAALATMSSRSWGNGR